MPEIAEQHPPQIRTDGRNPRIKSKISPSADGVGVDDLTLLILQQVRVGSVEHAGRSHCQRCGMLFGVCALAGSLHSDQTDLLVIHKLVEEAWQATTLFSTPLLCALVPQLAVCSLSNVTDKHPSQEDSLSGLGFCSAADLQHGPTIDNLDGLKQTKTDHACDLLNKPLEKTGHHDSGPWKTPVTSSNVCGHKLMCFPISQDTVIVIVADSTGKANTLRHLRGQLVVSVHRSLVVHR